MERNKKALLYPCLCYIGKGNWVRRVPLNKEWGRRYHGFRRFCFWALRLLADMTIGWDNR